MSQEMSKRRFFDTMAGRELWRDFSGADQPKLRRLLEGLQLRPGMTVLEPGCGKGRLTEVLCRCVGPTGTVIANDLSPRMLAEARRRGLEGRVRWAAGPAERIRLPAGTVDRIVCFQCFPHFDRKEQVLRRFRQFLVPDGILAIVHFVSRRTVNRIHSGHGGAVGADLIQPAPAMRRLLRQAGFAGIRLHSPADSYWLWAVRAP